MTDVPESSEDTRPLNVSAPILLPRQRGKARSDQAPPGGLLDRLGLGNPATGHPAARKARRSLIAHAFEAEIAPRLRLAHVEPRLAEPGVPRNSAVGTPDIDQLTQLVLRQDLGGGLACLAALRARGVTAARLSLDLLAPTARRLGEMWDNDLCTFTEVTLGLGVLRKLLGAAHGPLDAEVPVRDAARRVLLASIASEQHSFGLNIVADFFRKAGWDVTADAPGSPADLAAVAGAGWYAVAGLTLSTDAGIGPLALSIRAIRKASRNPMIGVMVGGPIFTARPELALLVGADLTAPDAEQAVLRAEGLRVLMSILPDGRAGAD